eukprot:5256801-Prymnesium_polylepis.1
MIMLHVSRTVSCGAIVRLSASEGGARSAERPAEESPPRRNTCGDNRLYLTASATRRNNGPIKSDPSPREPVAAQRPHGRSARRGPRTA